MANKVSGKRSHKWRIFGFSLLAVVLIIAVVLRLYLSSWLLDYVNDVLNNIPGYKGSVESINIDLYRSAYRINNLAIYKIENKIPVPFVSIVKTDLSLEWSGLLRGRVVSKINMTTPVINFAVKDESKQTGANVDWTKPIKDLMPIDIDYVKFHDGAITYQDFATTPHVNVFIHKMVGEVRNLRNVEEPNQPLPSTLEIRGGSIGNGDLTIKGRMNILKDVPDMDMGVTLEKVNLPALNSYTEAYASFDFESGEFNMYSQFKVKNSHVTGYVKPIVRHINVNILKKDNPLEVVWSTAVAAILEVFTNQSHDQFATRADLNGNLGNIDTDAWSILTGIFRNAFISAMTRGFDEAGDKNIIAPNKDKE